MFSANFGPGFDPKDVFRSHYRKACTTDVPNISLNQESGADTIFMLRAKLAQLIEEEFVNRYPAHEACGKSRFRVLQEFRGWLSQNKTRRACLACLRNASPDHRFPCEHMLCEGCCEEFGTCTEQDPSLYSFSRCPICAFECELKVRVRPATAGVRVLSLDGGGIRAKIPLQFLMTLEQAIGIDVPVQEHFEFAYGTSSGNISHMCAIR